MGSVLGPRYKLSDEEKEFEFKFKQKSPDAPQLSSHRIRGYRFKTEDGLDIVNFQQNGVNFSRLKPYTRWDSVFNEAERIWNAYRSACQPEEISRIAVRYINRILLPLPLDDFSVYFTVPPVALPQGLPPLINALLYRVILSEPATGIVTNITQVLDPPEAGHAPFILDIDAYIARSMDSDSPDIRSHFFALREMKNRVFFASLTPTAIDMFR
jgi:uncharacterized protein (TIGR04255 family)